TPQRITFCQGLHRDSVIWFLRTNTKVCPALAHQKCALTHGAQQSRNAAIGSATDQMSAKAALAVVCALWVRTVACGELHSSLLMRTVCRASGVYSERPRFSLVHVHPRYQGTPPDFCESWHCRGSRGRAPRENRGGAGGERPGTSWTCLARPVSNSSAGSENARPRTAWRFGAWQ